MGKPDDIKRWIKFMAFSVKLTYKTTSIPIKIDLIVYLELTRRVVTNKHTFAFIRSVVIVGRLVAILFINKLFSTLSSNFSAPTYSLMI